MSGSRPNARGFTLLEMMVSMGIFLVICAAMFSLLQMSQQRYNTETHLSGSFQEARLGIDQIVRDINISGYPSQGMFSNPPSTTSYAVSPFAWDPGYPTYPPCQVGACSTPSDFDLIVETDFGNGTGVNWIHYQLKGTTLYRSVVSKNGGDPVSATSAPALMTPFVENVMNNPPDSLLTEIQTQYPTMFPTGPAPLFQYTCSTPSGPQPCSTAAAPYNQVQKISDIDVTLIVKTQGVDLENNSLKLMELTGRGHRSNPTN
jgi:prepilin-type N-terminal cleavage/methylation domain-containing protein